MVGPILLNKKNILAGEMRFIASYAPTELPFFLSEFNYSNYFSMISRMEVQVDSVLGPESELLVRIERVPTNYYS